jgi:uncharacterized short protein YbdD (DUF466 family)
MRLETDHPAHGAARRAHGARYAVHVARRALSIIKTVFGMPDYDRYVEHRRECHPGVPVLSPSEFYAEHLKRRYEGGGPTRCC